MMTHVFLHGQLGKRFGKHWVLSVESPAAAVRAIAKLRPGFLKAIEDLNAVVEGYEVKIGDRVIPTADTQRQIALLEFPSRGRSVTITPIIQGADTKGILTIVAGVALIAVGLALSPFSAGTSTLQAFIGLQLIGLGAAVALGGVSRLIMSTPSPSAVDKTKQRASYVFSAVVNVAGQGECCPVLFGEMICGSQVVSDGVESFDVDATGKPGQGGQGGPSGGGHIGHQPPIPT